MKPIETKRTPLAREIIRLMSDGRPWSIPELLRDGNWDRLVGLEKPFPEEDGPRTGFVAVPLINLIFEKVVENVDGNRPLFRLVSPQEPRKPPRPTAPAPEPDPDELPDRPF